MSRASLLMLSAFTNTRTQILAQMMKNPTTTSISIKNGPEPDPLFLFIRLKSSAPQRKLQASAALSHGLYTQQSAVLRKLQAPAF